MKYNTIYCMKKIIFCALFVLIFAFPTPTAAKGPDRSKFYDFSEQLIDGEIRKPTALFTDGRKKVQFDRLLNLKKSFLPNLLNTAKERVFK